MYVCTDGELIIRSIVVSKSELAELNEKASESTGGNWRWEPGNKENAKLPKAADYRHISTAE